MGGFHMFGMKANLSLRRDLRFSDNLEWDVPFVGQLAFDLELVAIGANGQVL